MKKSEKMYNENGENMEFKLRESERKDEHSYTNEEQVSEYTLNDAIEHIGFGRYQVKVITIVGFSWMCDAMEMMILSIIAPLLKCKWNLSNSEEALITTMVLVGMSIGSFTWGYFSDRFGRKLGLNLSVAVVLIFGFGSSQAPNYIGMLILRLLVGFGVGGISQAAIISTELLPNSIRGKAIFILEIFWAVGSVSAAALAIATISTTGWRWYLIFVTIPSILFLLLAIWLPESPHYNLTIGKHKQVEDLLKKIAKENGKTLPPGRLVPGELNKSRGNMLELLSKVWLLTIIILWVLWFSAGFSYYGIVIFGTELFQTGIDGCNPYSTYSSNTTIVESCRLLTNTDYKDFMITSIAEFPALLLTMILIDIIGRKKMFGILFGLATLFYGLMMICTSRTVSVIFMFCVRGLATSAFQTAFVYTSEVLPTSIRGVGLGSSAAIGRIGAMTTPFVAQVLITESFYWCIMTYVILLLICTLVSFLLPIETKGKALKSSTNGSVVEKNGYQPFE